MKKKPLIVLLLLAAALIALAACSGGGEVAISKQPEDVTVSYPAGATFSVEVNGEDQVESYQWYLEDVVGNVFALNGITAQTPDLVVPATVGSNPNVDEYYCVITTKDGKEITSDHAKLNIENWDESKPVFYVGEYAIEPGQTLDLSEIDRGDGTPLGSGVVIYDANGTDITIREVQYDNTVTTCDKLAGPNVGFCLCWDYPEPDPINVTFEGATRVYNDYFDPDYNAGGIPFDFYFLGDVEHPLVNLIGDGSLELINGSYALRSIGDLMIGIDVTVSQTRQNYGDGIVAENVMVAEGSQLDLEVYGAAIKASGNLFLQGAELNIDANAPHISQGIATTSVLQSGRVVNIEDSRIDIQSHADPEVTNGIAGQSGIAADTEMYITGSILNYTLDALPKDDVYASNYCVISAGSLYVDSSELSAKVDCEDIFNFFGVYASEYATFENSKVDFDFRACGPVYGIAPEGDFGSDNSIVNVKVDTYDKFSEFGGTAAYGIMCGSFVMKADEPEQKVTSRAVNGIALGVNLNETVDDPVVYQEGYEPQNFFMRDSSSCLAPEDAVISTGCVQQGSGDYIYYLSIETVYSKADTSKPASEVVYGIK